MASVISLNRAPRRAALLPLLIWLLAATLTVGAAVFVVLQQRYTLEQAYRLGTVDIAGQIVLLAFPSVGALILWRQPGNRIGWLFGAAGLLWSVLVFSDAYAIYAGIARPGVFPGSLPAAFVATALNSVLALATPIAFFLLFPTGRLASTRWRAVAWLAGTGLGLTVLATMLAPGGLSDYPVIGNPVGVEALRSAVSLLSILGTSLSLLALLLAALSQIQRFRRASGDERLQIKWFALSAGLIVGAFLIGIVLLRLGAPNILVGVLVVATLLFLPISAGLAILRYHLYDIDILINRTLVYGLVMTVLGLGYVSSVLILGQLFTSLARGSDAAVTVSTLLMVAAFRPVQHRAQSAVDRRFYRRKYDATLTVAGFALKLREQVDLEDLQVEVCSVVSETLQPTFVSLWLRSPHGPVDDGW